MKYKETYKFGTDVSYLFKKQIFSKITNKKVLDVGCGTGEYLQYFGKNSLGLDIAKKNLSEAKTNKLNVLMFDANNPKGVNGKFDVIFCSHLLEHLENPLKLLRYFKKHLKKEGKLIISTPNEFSFIHLKFPYYTNNGNHLHSFSIANMKEIMLVAGFSLDKVYFDYYTSITKKIKLDPVLKLLDLLPVPIKYPFAWAFWFEATLKDA